MPFQDSAWGTLLCGASSSVSCWPPQIPFCRAIRSLFPPTSVGLSIFTGTRFPAHLPDSTHKGLLFLMDFLSEKVQTTRSLVLVRNIDSYFSSLTIRAARKQEVGRQMGSGDVWAVRSLPDLSTVDCIPSVLPFASLKYVRPWGFQIFKISDSFSSASSFLAQQPPLTGLQPFSTFQCQWLCRGAGLSLPSPVENSPSLRIKAEYLNVIIFLTLYVDSTDSIHTVRPF